MESKSSSGNQISTEQQPKNIVIRFVEYAFRILNNDMDEFFEDNMEAFDQNVRDLTDGSGETLEQYGIYQKYLQVLELYFDEFATQEGFETSSQCFDEINQLIADDEVERKKLFKEMAERMMEAFSNLQQEMQDESGSKDDDGKEQGGDDGGEDEEDEDRGSKGERKAAAKHQSKAIKDAKASKDIGDDDEESDAKVVEQDGHHQGTPAPPVVMFFQPVSLDSMLQHVLSLTEYTTFSIIIRTKLKQKQLYKSLQDRVEKHQKNTAKRQRNIERKEHLEDIYEELIQRICDFAPNQTQFQTQIRSHLNMDSWLELLSSGENGEEITPEAKVLFKRITMNVSMAIWNFVSIGEQIIVRQALTLFLPKIDQLQSNADLKIAAGNFLSMAHGLVDKTEQKMLTNLQEYYDKHHARKNQSKGVSSSHEEKSNHSHHAHHGTTSGGGGHRSESK